MKQYTQLALISMVISLPSNSKAGFTQLTFPEENSEKSHDAKMLEDVEILNKILTKDSLEILQKKAAIVGGYDAGTRGLPGYSDFLEVRKPSYYRFPDGSTAINPIIDLLIEDQDGRTSTNADAGGLQEEDTFIDVEGYGKDSFNTVQKLGNRESTLKHEETTQDNHFKDLETFEDEELLKQDEENLNKETIERTVGNLFFKKPSGIFGGTVGTSYNVGSVYDYDPTIGYLPPSNQGPQVGVRQHTPGYDFGISDPGYHTGVRHPGLRRPDKNYSGHNSHGIINTRLSGHGSWGTRLKGHGINGFGHNGYGVGGPGFKSHGVGGVGIKGHRLGDPGFSINGIGVTGFKGYGVGYPIFNNHGIGKPTIHGYGIRGPGVGGSGIKGHKIGGSRTNGHRVGGPGIKGYGIGGPGIKGHRIGGPGINGHGIGGPGIKGHRIGGPGINGHGIGGPGIKSHGIGGPGIKSHGIGGPGIRGPSYGYGIPPGNIISGTENRGSNNVFSHTNNPGITDPGYAFAIPGIPTGIDGFSGVKGAHDNSNRGHGTTVILDTGPIVIEEGLRSTGSSISRSSILKRDAKQQAQEMNTNGTGLQALPNIEYLLSYG